MENKENIENNNQTNKKEKRNYQMDYYNVMIKLFILSMIVFAALYFAHNLLVSYFYHYLVLSAEYYLLSLFQKDLYYTKYHFLFLAVS